MARTVISSRLTHRQVLTTPSFVCLCVLLPYSRSHRGAVERAVQVLRVSEEGDAHGSHGRGMHSACVGGIEFGHGGEEDIVEVGGFEGHVDKGVKEVPDKEASDLGGARFGG